MSTKYMRTVIDLEQPAGDQAPRRIMAQIPKECRAWLARWPELEISIRYVVRITDDPLWLWRQLREDGKKPGPFGVYLIWHTLPVQRREVTAAGLAVQSDERSREAA